jgi:hypothetical protein
MHGVILLQGFLQIISLLRLLQVRIDCELHHYPNHKDWTCRVPTNKAVCEPKINQEDPFMIHVLLVVLAFDGVLNMTCR